MPNLIVDAELVSMLREALGLLEVVDDRAAVICPKRRRGEYGDRQFEAIIHRLLIRAERWRDCIEYPIKQNDPRAEEPYVLSPLPLQPSAAAEPPILPALSLASVSQA